MCHTGAPGRGRKGGLMWERSIPSVPLSFEPQTAVNKSLLIFSGGGLLLCVVQGILVP